MLLSFQTKPDCSACWDRMGPSGFAVFCVCVWWHQQENIRRGWIMGRKWKSKNRIERTTRLSTPPRPLTVLIAAFTFTSLCCPFLSLLLLVHHFFLFVYRCLLPSFLCPVSALAFSSPCFLSRLSGLQLLFFTFSFCPCWANDIEGWRFRLVLMAHVSRSGSAFCTGAQLEMFKPSLMTLSVFILCTSTHKSEYCISQMQQVRQK